MSVSSITNPSSLGKGSLSLAGLCATIVAVMAIATGNWEGGSWFFTFGFERYAFVTYVCISISSIGLALGIAGGCQSTDIKLHSIVGTLWNGSLLLYVIFERFFYDWLLGPMINT